MKDLHVVECHDHFAYILTYAGDLAALNAKCSKLKCQGRKMCKVYVHFLLVGQPRIFAFHPEHVAHEYKHFVNVLLYPQMQIGRSVPGPVFGSEVDRCCMSFEV